MLSYISFGIFYKYGEEEEHRALKMLTLNPTKRLGELVGWVTEEISRRNISLDGRTFMVTQSKPNPDTGRAGDYQNRDSLGRVTVSLREILR